MRILHLTAYYLCFIIHITEITIIIPSPSSSFSSNGSTLLEYLEEAQDASLFCASPVVPLPAELWRLGTAGLLAKAPSVHSGLGRPGLSRPLLTLPTGVPFQGPQLPPAAQDTNVCTRLTRINQTSAQF